MFCAMMASAMATDLDNLPDPDILASEIIENIEPGLNSFKEIMETINEKSEERL